MNTEGSSKNDKEGEDSPYENMVRSLTNRGKNKRKVKLVEDTLIQLAFVDSDSDEDDEDFTLDDENEVDSDHSDYDGGDVGAREDDNDDDSSDGDEREDIQKPPMKLSDLLDAMKKTEQSSPPQSSILSDDDEESLQDHDVISNSKRILVCGICLESESNEEDEILECDNCGITVHEGCYGDIDTPDIDDKSDSDASTEPWFCEPCKAGVSESPICELCPNDGGIYKFTDSRKWVHLICALYTPFVGFRDVSKLQTVVLEDIRSSMWGGKECMFCLDDNYSRTGVCINCDAGMCKSSFHVTCAQRNGFLSDIPDKTETEDDSPDLLYAHCKLHSLKVEIEKRKRGWLTFKSHVQRFQHVDDTDEQTRIDDALNRAKQDFLDYQQNIIQPKQPPNEFARLLSSCPEACKMLAKKAEILGMLKHPGYNVSAAITSGKIIKHEANLSTEFVNYFYKREMESKELTRVLINAEPLLVKLRREQKALTKQTEEYHANLEKVRSDKEKLLKSCNKIHWTLHKLSGRTFKLPNILSRKHVKENKGKIEESTKLLNTIVNRCATCKQTTDQHMLAVCDTCKQHYHLACVDPPLLRMPKRSDKYLWQCTECDSSDESESEVKLSDTDGVRRNKKRITKEPNKFTPDETSKEKESNNLKRRSSSNNTTSKPKKKKAIIPKSDSETPKEKKVVVKRERTPTAKKEKPPPEVYSDCCICEKSGDKGSIVKCDECLKSYHFKTCLDPPYSKTPKGRGYGWVCEECDESEEEIDDDDDDNDKNE